MKLITLRWLIYTPCWSDPTSGNCRHQKAFMLSRGMPIYLHLPLLLRRDQSSYGMMWLWYYFPHIGGDCRTFNIYGWWLRLGLSQGLGKVTFRCPWVRYIWESIFWIMLTQENMSYYHDWKSFIHQWFGSKKNGMNIYVHHLVHGIQRKLNISMLPGIWIMPQILWWKVPSWYPPWSFPLGNLGDFRAWLGCFKRGKWGEGQVSFGSSWKQQHMVVELLSCWVFFCWFCFYVSVVVVSDFPISVASIPISAES